MSVHMPMGRRTFVRNTALGVGAAMLAHRVAWPASFDARIELVLNEELGTISPNIYGHFAENLGAVIYNGVWVGPGSKIPNVNGIRKSLVDALQKISSPVIRWPGGCFADSYDWKDGIGPRTSDPGAPISGPEIRWCADKATSPRNTIPTNSALMSLCNSAN